MPPLPPQVQAHVPLAPHTTLQVGGTARYLAVAHTLADVTMLLAWARSHGLPCVVLGGGSNMLIADGGYPGLVLKPALQGCSHSEVGTAVRVTAAAGMSWDALVAYTVGLGLGGVACLSGIPGWVGAAPVQNIGAYGQDIGHTLHSVHAIHLESGAAQVLPRDACGLGYRDSFFKNLWRGHYLITHVVLDLPRGAPCVTYAELQKKLAGDAAPSVQAVRDAVLALRRSKSMVYDTADANHRSAGSFFMNPSVPTAQAAALRQTHPTMPQFSATPGHIKLSAGWLIEHSGFARGYTQGAVGLSSRHALALVNRGGARAADIFALACAIQQAVLQHFGVRLRAEAALLGFSPGDAALLTG